MAENAKYLQVEIASYRAKIKNALCFSGLGLAGHGLERLQLSSFPGSVPGMAVSAACQPSCHTRRVR